MRKQVFSLMMVLAMVILAGTSAYAQFGSGTTPEDAMLFTVGSSGSFSVVPSNTNNYLVWDILEVSADNATVGEAGTVLTPGVAAGVDFVASLAIGAASFNPDGDADQATSTTAYVKFYDFPSDPSTLVYAIQVSEYEGGDGTEDAGECISIRRMYVAIFDFEVDVYFCDEAGDTAGVVYNGYAADGNPVIKNNWNNQVLKNTLTAGDLQAVELDSVDNPVHAFRKADTIYYAVEMKLTGNPSGFGLDDFDWRFNYSFPTQTNATLNRIFVGDGDNGGTPAFAGETVSTDVWGDDGLAAIVTNGSISPSSTAVSTYTTNNTITVPAADAPVGPATEVSENKYVFGVVAHKGFDETADLALSVRVDLVQLNFNGGYNDGSKENAASGTNEVDLTDGTTGTHTIYQSPATGIITIAR